jgi:hypothetical protein
MLDTFGIYGLEEELEDQMVAGDATGENFDGILHKAGPRHSRSSRTS